jgi:hypothetical protein
MYLQNAAVPKSTVEALLSGACWFQSRICIAVAEGTALEYPRKNLSTIHPIEQVVSEPIGESWIHQLVQLNASKSAGSM